MSELGVVLVSLAALAVALTSVLARRFAIPAPAAMLGLGLLAAFAPGLPPVVIEPELVLLTLLPPILYASGVGMSWRGFRSNLRPILLLAIGCVVFTAGTLAAVLHWLFAWPLALGFLLGAIVSPPDSVAPAAVLRNMPVPRRLKTVLEGESLINDATALVAFSFALGALTSGQFSLPAAVLSFLAIVIGEVVFGCLLGWAALKLRHWANEPRAEILLALATPYLAFWPPHHFGGSGVVACVTAGLWVSWNGRRDIASATRLQGYFIWNLVTWAVEATAFLLTGLQAKALTQALATSGWLQALEVSVVTVVAVVVVRFIWVFPATYLPRLIPAVRRADPHPHWSFPFFVASAGIRGVVSMIAALSIPLTLAAAPFPHRDEILIATFTTIAVTLFGLGALLGPLALRLGLADAGRRETDADHRDEQQVRLAAIDRVLAVLDREGQATCNAHEVAALRRRQCDRREQLDALLDPGTACSQPSGALQLRLLDTERAAISEAYNANRLTDPARRRIERELDLEEARIRHALASSGTSH